METNSRPPTMETNALNFTLARSTSAEGLTCRRPTTLAKSGSCGTLPHRVPSLCLPDRLPRAPPGAAWRALSSALTDAFAQCDDVSPDHPAATCVKGLDTAALLRDLAELQVWVAGSYTRSTCLRGDGFEVLMLCWPPECCSPVHAHSDAASGVKSNCFMAVLQGALTETLYEPHEIEGDKVVGFGTSRVMSTGASTYINDDYGVHKVGNDSATVPAVSLHVYAPGWSTVQIYSEAPADAGGAPIDADGWGDF